MGMQTKPVARELRQPRRFQCELIVSRGAGGLVKTFLLQEGRRVTFGCKLGNDIVVDTKGASHRHAELFVQEDRNNDGPPRLCIRDKQARNGTAVRSKSDETKAWETLEKGGVHALGDGWQLKIPRQSRSRKTGDQAKDDVRLYTLSLSPWVECEATQTPPATPFTQFKGNQVWTSESFKQRRAGALEQLQGKSVKAKAVKPAKAASETKGAVGPEQIALAQAAGVATESAALASGVPEEIQKAGAKISQGQAVALGRWRNKRARATEAASSSLAENTSHAEVDAGIGLKPHKELVPKVATSEVAPPSAPREKFGTRPKKRAKTGDSREDAKGGAEDVLIDSSPEPSRPTMPANTATRLTASALKQHRAAANEVERDWLLGQSTLREMSVSPISAPGVATKKKKKKPTPACLQSSEDSSEAPAKRKKKKATDDATERKARKITQDKLKSKAKEKEDNRRSPRRRRRA